MNFKTELSLKKAHYLNCILNLLIHWLTLLVLWSIIRLQPEMSIEGEKSTSHLIWLQPPFHQTEPLFSAGLGHHRRTHEHTQQRLVAFSTHTNQSPLLLSSTLRNMLNASSEHLACFLKEQPSCISIEPFPIQYIMDWDLENKATN